MRASSVIGPYKPLTVDHPSQQPPHDSHADYDSNNISAQLEQLESQMKEVSLMQQNLKLEKDLQASLNH
jgi:hypothetical protein